MTANLNRDTKTKPQPYSPADFMNYINKPEESELTPEEEFSKIDADVFGL
jgi:hypothetical protein